MKIGLPLFVCLLVAGTAGSLTPGPLTHLTVDEVITGTVRPGVPRKLIVRGSGFAPGMVAKLNGGGPVAAQVLCPTVALLPITVDAGSNQVEIVQGTDTVTRGVNGVSHPDPLLQARQEIMEVGRRVRFAMLQATMSAGRQLNALPRNNGQGQGNGNARAESDEIKAAFGQCVDGLASAAQRSMETIQTGLPQFRGDIGNDPISALIDLNGGSLARLAADLKSWLGQFDPTGRMLGSKKVEDLADPAAAGIVEQTFFKFGASINTAFIELGGGTDLVTSEYTGSIGINLTSSGIQDKATVTVTEKLISGSGIDAGGFYLGPFTATLVGNQPEVAGTLNVVTGEANFHAVTKVSSPLLQAMGIPSVTLDMQFTGMGLRVPNTGFSCPILLFGEGAWPANMPLGLANQPLFALSAG